MSDDDPTARSAATTGPVRARVYLFRHGRVDARDHEVLAPEGLAFRDALPAFFGAFGVELAGAYHDASARRCAASVERLACPKVGYAPGHALRTINAVLAAIDAGDHAICCRGDSLESGQLYHVQGFELHTPFETPRHGEAAREALRGSYHTVYCLVRDGPRWTQRWRRQVPVG